MIDPLTALLMFCALGLLCGVLFWPQRGLFWVWYLLGRRSERVLIEDALKHLHASEYAGRQGTLHSVAGALGISADRSANLLAQMESLGLLCREGGELVLSGEGRLQALHMIRSHRLWERHLAESTGTSASDWHRLAEQREHTLTDAEVEALDSSLNYPLYDPHGDPIPTAGGELPPSSGVPLTELRSGQQARIVHLEDEPAASFAQLAAMRLNPGMAVRLIEVLPERVRFWARGSEHVLAPVIAANISVVPLADAQPIEQSERRLVSLDVGEQGTVLRIARSCRGLKRQRLLDLGVVPGTRIEAQMISPMGDPVGYFIRGAVIALRREAAEAILIESEVA